MTEYSAIVKLAPVATAQRAGDPAWQGRTMLWRSDSLRLLPKPDVPVLLDHDPNIVLGRVDELFRLDWPEPGGGPGPWLCARCTLTDPPNFLKPYRTRASFGRHGVHEHDDRITQAFVSEVSLLVASEPLEPRAELISLQRTESSTAPGEVITTTGLIRRPSIGRVLGIR